MKRTIKVITEANPDLSFAIIVNNFAANQTVDRQFLELLEADDLPVLGTVPTAAAFKQGAALGKPVYEIAKSGKAALAIENILDEIEEVL
ncbi:MAG: ParA family protein [Collinsella sp.]